MTEADGGPGTGDTGSEIARPNVDLARAVGGAFVILLALAAAGYAIYRERSSFADALRSISAGALVASFAFGLIGVLASYPMWREILEGLEVDMPWGPGFRVFFVSQLGKYLPGSVWPVVMQMEAGKARGASRRTMFAGNIITIFLNSAVGLLIACMLLPFYDAHVLARYWWALLAIPFLLALLHPRAITGLLDWAFTRLHRPALHEHLEAGATVRASCWSVVSWLGMGMQLGVLCAAVGNGAPSRYLLCIGAMALAIPLGVLFIPAPAGAGIRDVILVLVLSAPLGAGPALGVVIVSRVLLIIGDLLLAGVAGAMRRWKNAPAV